MYNSIKIYTMQAPNYTGEISDWHLDEFIAEGYEVIQIVPHKAMEMRSFQNEDYQTINKWIDKENLITFILGRRPMAETLRG